MMPLQWITFGDYTEPIRKIKDAGIPIMVMVQSVEEAIKAAELGASAIVAQVHAACFIVLPLKPCLEQVSTLPANAWLYSQGCLHCAVASLPQICTFAALTHGSRKH